MKLLYECQKEPFLLIERKKVKPYFEFMKKQGLTKKQVEERIKNGQVNYDTTVKTKSIKAIIVGNIFTIFNLLNFALALAIFAVGSYRNLLFMGIVICNTLISIIQEIRSKKAIDKLSVISAVKVIVIRDGQKQNIGINELVVDDIFCIEIGNQIVTDSILQEGEIEVNEAFITGESNNVTKKKGDMLLSGSFVISGSGIAKVKHVAGDNYTAKISSEAKYIKQAKSEIMVSLNKIIKTVSILIIPIGMLLFHNQMTLERKHLSKGSSINSCSFNRNDTRRLGVTYKYSSCCKRNKAF